jgi:hypothetical protein
MVALAGADGRAATDVLQPHPDAHPRLRWIVAASVRDLAVFAHELLPADLLVGIPTDAGRGLGDVFAGAWVTETGEWEAELVVDQRVLDLVRQRTP